MSNFDPTWVRISTNERAARIRADLVGPNASGARGQLGRLGMRRFGRRATETERTLS
ncbi:hypothetical protein [Nocardioides sp.]|uniref:hypothetical protein n=1 Tax=Nocardioides sp. TaxID=35761 RepID=UPI00262FB36B|nr:hypothetical protein [Nocardioides sp.]